MMTNYDKGLLSATIGLLIVLAFVLFIVLVFFNDADGQTIPMQPIDFWSWEPHPLGIYLCTIDTYKQLQKINAELDTVPILIHDSLNANWATFTDTVTSYRTAIHDSLDANWTTFTASGAADAVYCATSTDGYQVVDKGDTDEQVKFNSDIKIDGTYTHPATSWWAIAVGTTGWYEVSWSLSWNALTSTDANIVSKLMLYNASWGDLAGSAMYDIIGSNHSDKAVMARTFLVEAAAGDSIAVFVRNADSVDDVQIIRPSIYIKKLH